MGLFYFLLLFRYLLIKEMLSSSEILHEYAKCIQDPIYAIGTYLETKDLTQGGFVPFKLFPRQKEIVRAYEKYPYNLVTKPRQAGISTTTQAYMAIKAAFADPDKPETILIIANKLKLAQKFVRGIKDYLLQLPRWVWGPEYYGSDENEDRDIFISNSKIEIELPNGTQIVAVATSEDALRGYTPTYLIFDEAAFIDNGDAVYTAAMSSCATGGRVMLISTPNGMDPLYYKTYEQSKIGKNSYNIIEMKWYEDPRYIKNQQTREYDLRWIKKNEQGEIVEEVKEVEFNVDKYPEKLKQGYKPTSSWYENMCGNLNHNARRIAQELDVSFLGSGGNVIADEDIVYHEENNVQDPKWVDGVEKEFWVWEEPIEGHEYIMGCLPPGEKVLTNSGLKNIELVSSTDKLINESGEYVDIINKQIYSVVDETVYEMKMDNTFRTTKFTKEHPILISKPNLKRNYSKTHKNYKFNERYWDFDFKYTRMEEVCVGDWVKVPNIYKRTVLNILDDKWKISDNISTNFEVESPLNTEDFWWFVGIWLGDGWLGHYKKDSYTVSICFDKSHNEYIEKAEGIIKKLFKRSPSFIDKGTTFELVFGSKFLYHFLLENFGQYSYGKKINEWVKFIPNNLKKELVRGYFDSDGCWVASGKKNKVKSKISFVSINLELLEGFQDIIFSLGIVSSLNKLRDAKNTNICGKECYQKEAYNLCLGNNDSLELINLIYKKEDVKLNKFNISDFTVENKRTIKSCHFDETKDYIYFRVKGIEEDKFTGNVYNFECDTHTFMCHHITTHNCDVSRGDGEDSSTIVIIDFTTMTQVMEYQGKCQPDILAEHVYKYGNHYKAYTVVDITGGMGVSTVLKLIELKYKYLHYDEPRGKILNSKKNQLNTYSKDEKMPGFNANGVRLPMIGHLEYMIRTDGIKIRSRRLTSEMKTFIYKNGRPDHMDGYHDDLLMAMGMPLWVLEHSFKKLEKLEKQSKAILSSWTVGGSKPKEDRDGFVPKKMRNKGALPKPKFSKEVSKNMQDPSGDYLWLFSGSK
jgi:hypothetical protein